MLNFKERIKSLNENDKINMNKVRRISVHEEGVFNDYISDAEI